jgi:excisionase family DNA binding protein
MAPEPLMTYKEVAEYLQIALSTAYQMVHLEKIPCIKIGRVVRFRKQVIDKFLEEKSQDVNPIHMNKKKRRGGYLKGGWGDV